MSSPTPEWSRLLLWISDELCVCVCVCVCENVKIWKKKVFREWFYFFANVWTKPSSELLKWSFDIFIFKNWNVRHWQKIKSSSQNRIFFFSYPHIFIQSDLVPVFSHTHTHTYIYVCVCACVCVCLKTWLQLTGCRPYGNLISLIK